MVETRIRQVQFSCNRCGEPFLIIDNCIIPLIIKKMIIICTSCSAVLKKREDIVMMSYEPDDNTNLKKEFFNAEKYI